MKIEEILALLDWLDIGGGFEKFFFTLFVIAYENNFRIKESSQSIYGAVIDGLEVSKMLPLNCNKSVEK